MITCFDIGGSAIKGAIAEGPAQLRALGRMATPLDDFDAFAKALAMMTQAGGAPDESLISIAIAGVVDSRNGVIKCANIPCINGRHLAADLTEMFGRPVLVANDADCFALAEAQQGAGRGQSVVFGVILGTGVGGGLVINGQVLSGAGGFAGEWGHGPVLATSAGDPPLPIERFACGCGQQGCVDTVGGARGLERLHRYLHRVERTSTQILDGWLKGHRDAGCTVDCYVDLVASPLALAVNTVGADMVPVGGGLANCHPLLERLDITVRDRILRHTSAQLVVPGTCHGDAGLIGAALLGYERAVA